MGKVSFVLALHLGKHFNGYEQSIYLHKGISHGQEVRKTVRNKTQINYLDLLHKSTICIGITPHSQQIHNRHMIPDFSGYLRLEVVNERVTCQVIEIYRQKTVFFLC